MAAALIVLPFCNDGSIVGFVIGMTSLLLSSLLLLTPAVSSSVVTTTTSRDVGRWGAQVGAQSQQDWARGRVNIERRWKNGKKSWHHASCDAQF